MMEEIKGLTIELISELTKLSEDEIEDFRQEWLDRIRERKEPVNMKFIEAWVNYTCDYVVKRVTEKTA